MHHVHADDDRLRDNARHHLRSGAAVDLKLFMKHRKVHMNVLSGLVRCTCGRQMTCISCASKFKFISKQLELSASVAIVIAIVLAVVAHKSAIAAPSFRFTKFKVH